ncbi:NADH dehydrogenase 1 alpha subcomplex subunit 8 [Trichonephila clavata]|uniref:NADH dehydrogenase 1 alpha subcomplex subunit 8 n=2 Tax=Trichonephila clavata TaxID=2740835 RepID=A0A8X6M633_TRICU|nr:NADH dehydrogenase 1 alpha subcomplex subunit 8 [Trichonephila clavata]
MNVFQSLLVSKLTIIKTKPVIDSMQDLVAKENVKGLVPIELEIQEVLKDSGIPLYEEAWEKLKLTTSTFDEVLSETSYREVMEGKACIVHGQLILKSVLQEYFQTNGRCDFHLSENYFFPFPLLMGLRKTLPKEFQRKFNSGKKIVNIDLFVLFYGSVLRFSEDFTMPFSEDFYLPSPEELKVQEINVSTPTLKAGAIHFGKYCDEQCKEFMLCRKEENDPRRCVQEGKEVTACGIEFFQKVKQHCKNEFEQYADCLEWNSPAMHVQYCRKTQAVLDKCMLEKLNIERPYLGYFTEIRTHKTNRPHPGPPLPRKEYVDDRPSLPPDYPIEDAKFGSAWFMYN